MAQFARPDADQATGSWSSTPLWSKVDEGSSGDDVVITSDDNTNPDNADLRLSAVTDPASSSGHIIRVEWNKDSSGGHTLNPDVQLWEGIPGTGTLRATLAVTNLGNTPQTDTYTLSGAEADAITNYGDLYFRVRRVGDTGGNPNGRRSLVVDFVELEVPDAAAPPQTVNASPVAFSLASPTPTVSATGSAPVTASPAAFNLAAPTATVSGTGAAPVTASPVVFSLAVPTPSITNPQKINATAVVFSLSAPTPAVSATGTATVQPSPVAFSLASPTPTVSGSGTAPITASPVAFSLAVPTPVVATGGIIVNAAPVVFDLAAPTPTVAATGAAPVTATPVAFSLVAPAPSVSGSGTASVNASPAAFSLAVPTPVVAVAAAPATVGKAFGHAFAKIDRALGFVSASLARAVGHTASALARAHGMAVAPMSFLQGQICTFSVDFWDSTDSKGDPTTVTLRLSYPSSEATYVFGTDAEVVKDAVGEYHADISLAEAGPIRWEWEGTGALVAKDSGQIKAESI